MYVCVVYTYYGIEERERRKLHLKITFNETKYCFDILG